LAIQPAQQADQPEATMKDDSRSKLASSSLWWQVSLIVLASLAAITLLAAAPICHYTKWRNGLTGSASATSDLIDDSQQNVFQRLIGIKLLPHYD
jgi:hypothetical protein